MERGSLRGVTAGERGAEGECEVGECAVYGAILGQGGDEMGTGMGTNDQWDAPEDLPAMRKSVRLHLDGTCPL